MSIKASILNYQRNMEQVWDSLDHNKIELLANDLQDAWEKNKSVFICGNGGSAANANHLANDFIYGICPEGKGLKVQSLSANSSVTTCLANDTGYENVFSHQLQTLGSDGDLLIVLSGSGSSPNVVNAILKAKELGIQAHAIVGFDGGECLTKADNSIHILIDDMQTAEDFQIILGHIITKSLRTQKEEKSKCY